MAAALKALSSGYTAAEVAHILGVSEGRVRAFVKAGLLQPAKGPRGEHRFNVQDLVVLRTARSLSERLPAGRVQRALQRVREQVPDRPLAAVQVTLLGEHLVARDGRAMWQPESGQQVLDFDSDAAGSRVARMPAREDAPGMSASQWYERGCDRESDSPDEAFAAYEEALAVDPHHAGARINLGRLLQEAGRAEEAVDQYRRVLAHEPGHALAAFNLGVALEDLGRAEEAVAAYEMAVAADPGARDAHYNLSRLHETAGRLAQAIQHLKTYRSLL